MKRIFLLMLVVAGLLTTSCKKNDLEPTFAGAEVPVTLSASMEGATTRAIANYGTASKVNRAILEVYYDGEVYKRMVAPLDTEGDDTKTVDFDLRLISGREYNFVVWADKINGDVVKEESYNSTDNTNIDLYYETNNGLDEITIIEDKDYLGCNDDERDAFYGVQTKKVEGATTVTMTLRRPFGQINVLTKLTGVKDSDLPEFVQVTYSTDIAHTFNALSEETSNYKALAWSDKVSVIEIATSDEAEAIHLSTDYIFAPKDGQDLVDFSMKFFKEDGSLITTNNKLSNIPVQRNCRTNVSGELLNENVDVDVNIDSTPSEIKGVETVADLNTAMYNDKGVQEASYVVNGEITEDGSTITIPDFNRCDATRSITLKEGIANSTTLKITTNNTSSPATDPKFVYITVPDDNQGSLDIDLPNSTVYINGKLTTINGITAVSTLIIQEDAVVENLIIEKGNVEIYGTVTNISRSSENSTKLTTVYIPEGVTKPTTSDPNIQFVTHKNILVPRLGNFETINEAIAAADDNTYTIVLAAGDYNEALIINKRVHIKGPNIGEEGYSSERVPEANLCNTVTISADDIYLSGVAFSGVLESPAARVTTTGDIENLNLEYIKADGIGYTFFQSSGSLKNLVVEDSKIANIKAGTDKDKKYAFFIGGLESATFKGNVFDHIGYHALNLNQSADASSLKIENNTFTNCYSDAIQLANNIVGDIDIKGNTISNCGAAFSIYAWDEYYSETLTERAFSANLNISGNEISKVYALAEIGYALYYNVAVHGHEKGYFEALPFDKGASIVFDNNKISLGTAPDAGFAEAAFGNNIIMLGDFYGYEGTIEFKSTNDVTGGAAGYNTWSDILNQNYTMYLFSNEATVVKIGDHRYSGAGRGQKVTEITE